MAHGGGGNGVLPWEVRAGVDATLLLLAALQLVLASVRADGYIGGSWGAIFVPGWLACTILLFYTVTWVVNSYYHGYDGASSAALLPEMGVGVVFANDVGAVRDEARAARRTSPMTALSNLLYGITAGTMALALLATLIMLAVHLDGGASPTVSTAVSPLVVWLSLAVATAVLRPVWRHTVVAPAAAAAGGASPRNSTPSIRVDWR